MCSRTTTIRWFWRTPLCIVMMGRIQGTKCTCSARMRERSSRPGDSRPTPKVRANSGSSAPRTLEVRCLRTVGDEQPAELFFLDDTGGAKALRDPVSYTHLTLPTIY